MNKLQVFKLVANLVVGSGTTTISNSIIRNNVQPSTVAEHISTAVASVVIGSMAQQATRSHTNARIDEAVAAWNHIASSTEDSTPEV